MKHLGTKELYSKRLILRKIKEADAEEIYNGFINQEEFLYYANKQKRTLEEEKESLVGIDAKYQKSDYYNWLITLKDTKAIIGSINANIFQDDSVIFNYAIDNRYTKKGYMTEALDLVINFFLEDVKLDKVYCGCVTKNTASKKVMENNNMKLEKVIPKYVELSDGLHDMYLYSKEKIK